MNVFFQLLTLLPNICFRILLYFAKFCKLKMLCYLRLFILASIFTDLAISRRIRLKKKHEYPKYKGEFEEGEPEHPFKAERERYKKEAEDENPFDTRIAGGNAVLIGDTPYHVQVRYLDDYLCGAALVISPHGNQVVITAGQCVTQKKPSKKFLPARNLAVIGGRLKRDGFHIYEQFRAVTHIERHPDWRRKSVGLIHDIAVLHIEFEFELNRLVSPIALPTYTDVNPYGRIIISGWGYYFHTQKEYADRLRVSIIETVYNDDCNSKYVYDDNVPKLSFCAGKIRSPTYQGACIGDEGAPGIALFNGTFFLGGIYSWGTPRCGNRYKPSVFTSVAWYIRWLLKAAYPRPGRKKRDLSEIESRNFTSLEF